MNRRSRLRASSATLLLLVLLTLPGRALAAEPPNQNDPCANGGRDTCGTTGIGFYDTYSFGVRWFGDFKGVIPGLPRGFCIDLRFWYPSAAYKFAEDTSGVLVNRDKEKVSFESQRRIAYAIWAYGRSTVPTQQAAVMLYVHSQMGDARPGEASPDELDASVGNTFAKIARDAAAFHGPYRVAVSMPGALKLGARGTATIRVLSAGGNPLPGVTLKLKADGAAGVTSTAKTGENGVAQVSFTATSADDAKLEVSTEPLPSTLPRVFRPTTAAAAPNGQRLVIPSSQVVTGTGMTAVAKSRLTVTSAAVPAEVAVAEGSTDRVTIKGASPTFKVTVTAKLHGPFRSPAEIRCDQKPAWQGTWRTSGSGVTTTKPVSLDTPGWYVYQHAIPGDANHVGVTTSCSDARERVKVVAVPSVKTVVSEQVVAPGAEISDRVTVAGLAGEPATVEAALYGPFATKGAITCDATPVWKGSIAVTADGEFTTEAVKLDVPGFYAYHETLVGGDFVKSAQTLCGEVAETTIVTGTPAVRTLVSAKQTRPGSMIHDTVIVTGLGKLAATVNVVLYGPFPTVDGIACGGTPAWSGTLKVNGDGTYRTAPFRIARVGYYTYRESLVETPQHSAFEGKCAETSETTLSRAAPRVTTLVSSEVVIPGATIADHVRVTGLGRSEARVDLELFGPFSSRAAIRCTGAPYWTGSLTAKGDGTFRSAPVKLARAGFYTFRERLVATDLVSGTQGECAEVAETALARPLVLTGKGEHTSAHAQVPGGPLTPTRVQLEARGIDAGVFTAGIDLTTGALDVPKDIRRAGWWGDGVVPGSPRGAVLIAGHVDSASAGAGAFFGLKDARPGDLVRVTTKGGRVFTYKVVSLQTMVKAKLPPAIYSRQGRPRLVLVTCGGPFIESEGHYRDNIVVTAIPT